MKRSRIPGPGDRPVVTRVLLCLRERLRLPSRSDFRDAIATVAISIVAAGRAARTGRGLVASRREEQKT
jgi:hypothetical protein